MGGAGVGVYAVKKQIISILLFLAAFGLLTAGILTGQPAAVFAKAARICMECVGIG